MNYEEKKQEFIKLLKEELDYLDSIVTSNNNKELSEDEVLKVHRKVNYYTNELNVLLKEVRKFASKNRREIYEKNNGVMVEFDIKKNYLSDLKCNDDFRKYALKELHINPETYKVEIPYNLHGFYPISESFLLNIPSLNGNIYISAGCYREYDSFGTSYTEYGQYYYINGNYSEDILKSKMGEFEKDKTIIKLPSRVRYDEVQTIYKEELDNEDSKTIDDCINRTKIRINELSYERDPNTKERVLLDKINKLYKMVKGEFISDEILYNGDFIKLFKETYKLPNDKVVEKERAIKNGGKNGVIIIPIVPFSNYRDREFIITVQNRMKDKLIAEFPSGYIEDGESPIEAAKRELLEETGYTTDNLFILDEAYISPGIDNAINYIVVAYNCVKTNEQKLDTTELVTYGLFKENELKYIIDNNIMNGAMNKLAYYDFINNVDGSGYVVGSDYMIKNDLRKKCKKNPLDTWK